MVSEMLTERISCYRVTACLVSDRFWVSNRFWPGMTGFDFLRRPVEQHERAGIALRQEINVPGDYARGRVADHHAGRAQLVQHHIMTVAEQRDYREAYLVQAV